MTMCLRCDADRQGKFIPQPATQTIGLVEFVAVADLPKSSDPDDTGNSMPPIQQQYFLDAGEAKMRSLLMVQDPAIGNVRMTEHVVSLN